MRSIAFMILGAFVGVLLARFGPDERALRSRSAMAPASVLPESSSPPSTNPSLLQSLSEWQTLDSLEAFQVAWAAKLPNRMLKRLFISEWVAFDAASALDQGLALTGEDQRLFLAEIFLANAELGLSHLRAISRSKHPHWLNQTVEAWHAQAGDGKPSEMIRLAKTYQLDKLDPAASILADPASALAEAELIEDPKERGDRVATICKAWYRIDPISAWKYAKEHLPPSIWQGASFSMFDDWMRKDPRTAFAFRQDLAMRDPSYWYERLGSHWGPAEDFRETLEAVKDTPEGSSTRSIFVAGLVHGGSVGNADQGFALLRHLPKDGQHRNGRAMLLAKIRDLLVKEQDANAAIAWMEQLDDPYERLGLQQSFPEEAFDSLEFISVFKTETDPDRVFDALRKLSRRPTFDAKTLNSLLASVSTEHWQQACRQVLDQMPPAEAFAFGEQHGGEFWESDRSEVISRWKETNPKGVLEALSSDDRAAQWVLESWYKARPNEANAWVNAQIDAQWQTMLESARTKADRDQIRAQLYRGDVPSWPDLVEREAAVPEKTSLFPEVVQRWARVDPAAASAFLSDPDNRARMNPRTLEEINKRQEFMDAVATLKDF